ncbi:glucose dehydrogenase [FAD, quinone]-like [Centruroides sculpturatus]|uniref:glucose dehydrogenase [FAD, quinone]-like n=1 Tax=Centruroides sculpturatus TaxID=218467 RepID=UPI000C6E451D|nr:glucose dehydrogenase [FAD, quinone]-like [Centruroides sculpturatus]
MFRLLFSGGALDPFFDLIAFILGVEVKTKEIPVVSDLPVGLNLQDHIFPLGMDFLIDKPVAIVAYRVLTPFNALRYFKYGSGPWTTLGGVEGLAFINTRFANSSDDYPDIELYFVTGSLTSDGGEIFIPAFGINNQVRKLYYGPILNRDVFTIYPTLIHPKSRGYVKLRSTNPYDHPVIQPNYLSHPQDVLRLIDAMKITIQIGESKPFRKFGSRLYSTPVPGCERFLRLSDEYLECIPVVSDLPVGLNLQDHIFPLGMDFLIDKPVAIVAYRVLTPFNALRYFKYGSGPWTTLGGVEGLAFINTRFANSSDDYPDIELYFVTGSLTSDGGEIFIPAFGINNQVKY